VDGDGLEHLSIGATPDGLRADGVLIGARGGRPYGISYHILLGADFSVRAFGLAATDGMALALVRGPDGWRDAEGRHLPGFDDCLDIDLAGTPFTNTLPIRRERWEIGQRRAFRMLYVPFDTFEPVVDEQVYTCLGPRLFRYEAADGSFAADLPLVEHGRVLDYPTLFQRC
jgi:hypothetical protein